jgi:hypothetical protein
MAQDVTRKFEVWINDKTQPTIYTRADVLKLRAKKRCRSATDLEATNCQIYVSTRKTLTRNLAKTQTLHQISAG